MTKRAREDDEDKSVYEEDGYLDSDYSDEAISNKMKRWHPSVEINPRTIFEMKERLWRIENLQNVDYECAMDYFIKYIKDD